MRIKSRRRIFSDQKPDAGYELDLFDEKPFSEKNVEALIVDAIVRRVKPQRIVLFGSRARGDAPERADYDIAIDDEALTPARLAQIRADMDELPTLLSIDIVWMDRANAVLRERILSEGKILYEQ